MNKFRLVTRSDFDGLVCAVLLKHLDMIDDILFVHPKDMQDKKIEITKRDITTNLPYVPECYLSFDHHISETKRNVEHFGNHIIDSSAPSAARVVWNHYGGTITFPEKWQEMMDAVDKGDSGNFSLDEIKKPTSWVLLNFLMDARTGLGRFHDFRISNYQLMMELIDYCRNHTIHEILCLPDVKERIDLYNQYKKDFIKQLKKCSNKYENLIILDLRNEEIIYPGNRFMIYALYPECNISIHILKGFKGMNTVFATGKSILNKTSKTNVGELMLKYVGGGHDAAGTCQVEHEDAERVLNELIIKITQDG